MGTVARIWDEVSDIFWAAWDIIDGILDFFIALFQGDWEGMWEAVKEIARAGWEIITSILSIAWEVLKLAWQMLWEGIKIVAAAAWAWIKSTAASAWEGIKNFLAGVWQGIKDKAATIWGSIVDFFVGIWESITSTAKDTIDGGGGLLEFFQKLPGRILEAVAGFGIMILDWLLQSLISMYFAADRSIWSTVLPFCADLPMKSIRAMPGVLSWLYNTGKNILKGMWTGITWYFNNIFMGFWRGLKWAILIALPNTLTWLVQLGKNILTGLLNGIKWLWTNLVSYWLGDLTAKIVAAAGNMLSVLYAAGKAVMQGFWNGLKAKWGSVKRWLSGLTGWIPDWKGPYSEDLKILVDNGEAVMMGLQRGMEKGFTKRVVPLLQGYTNTGIPNALGTGTSTVNNNDNGQIFQFGDIISQADPDEIAQAIAWELRMA